MRTVFLALLILIWSSISALAVSAKDIYTYHTALAVPEQSYQEARLWFLPDWQAGMTSRTDTAPSGSGEKLECRLNMLEEPVGLLAADATFPDLQLQKFNATLLADAEPMSQSVQPILSTLATAGHLLSAVSQWLVSVIRRKNPGYRPGFFGAKT